MLREIEDNYRLFKLGCLGFLGLTLVFSPGICDRKVQTYSLSEVRKLESLEGTVFPTTQVREGGCVECHSDVDEFKKLVEERIAEERDERPHPEVDYLSESRE